MRFVSGVGRVLGAVAAVSLGVVSGCGDSPSASRVTPDIEKAIVDGRPGVEAAGVTLSAWKETEMPGLHSAEWTGKVRLKEDHGYILAVVDGKNIVKVVAKAGEELPVSGGAVAGKQEGQKEWHYGAHADPDDQGGWAKKLEELGPTQAGYRVLDGQGQQVGTKFRGARLPFEPLSALKPYILEGSEEDKALGAQIAERQRKAQEAYQAQVKQRQEAQAAEAARQKAEAEERQRQYEAKVAADLKAREEAAAAALKAREEAAAAAAEKARVTRLSPVLRAFQPGTGAVLTAEAGPELGALLYDVQLDEPGFKATGKGLDLREMPFKEFTFECAAADLNGRATFTYTPSNGSPLTLVPAAGGLAMRGAALTALSEADRARLDAIAALGRTLGAGPARDLPVEVLEAAEAKAREMDTQTEGLTGTVFYRGRADPRIAPLFTVAGTRGNAWKAETVAIRLKEPARGKSLLIKGVNPTDNLVVVVNGIHRAKIAAIPKGGSAIVGLPEGQEVMDIRLEAVGAASARGVVLVK